MPSAKIWLRQSLALLPVAYIKFSIGLHLGWIAPSLKLFSNSTSILPLTVDDISWIASLHEFGRCIGPLMITSCLNDIGCKSILIICALIFNGLWFAVVLMKSVSTLYMIRFIFGIGLGMYDVMSSIYLNENCIEELKGIFNSVTRLSFYLGLLVQFILASYLPYRIVAFINLANGLLINTSTELLKEPFLFLVAKGDEIKARRNFMWLRGENNWDNVSTEFHIIRTNAEESDQTEGDHYLSTIFTVVLNASLAATGHGAILAYATFIFPPSEYFSSSEFAIFYAIIAFVSICVSSLISHKLDSKAILQLMFPLIFVIHLYITLLFYNQIDVPINDHPWWILMSVGCFSFTYALVESAIFKIKEDLFPRSRKAEGECLGVLTQGVVSLVIIKAFFVIMHHYGAYVSFLTLAYFGFVMDFILYVVFARTCWGPRLHSVIQ